jgi:hypothetical protein
MVWQSEGQLHTFPWSGSESKSDRLSVARLLGRVGDLEAMNEKTGHDKDRDGKAQQAKDGDERRDRFGDNRENRHRAIDGQFDRAEMLQIESDAQPLCPGRKNRSERLPAHQHGSGDDGILEKKAESEKHGAISDTREGGHKKIGT